MILLLPGKVSAPDLSLSQDNERKRLEEIIIENVELKENLDKMTDELMDAIDEQTLMRTKYEQMELKLANVKESLLREIINTRNPRVSYKIYYVSLRSMLNELRLLSREHTKFNNEGREKLKVQQNSKISVFLE